MNTAPLTRIVMFAQPVGIATLTPANSAEFYARATLYAKERGGTAPSIQEIRRYLGLNIETVLPDFTPMSRMEFRRAMKDIGHPIPVQELERLKAVFEASAPEACEK